MELCDVIEQHVVFYANNDHDKAVLNGGAYRKVRVIPVRSHGQALGYSGLFFSYILSCLAFAPNMGKQKATLRTFDSFRYILSDTAIGGFIFALSKCQNLQLSTNTFDSASAFQRLVCLVRLCYFIVL